MGPRQPGTRRAPRASRNTSGSHRGRPSARPPARTRNQDRRHPRGGDRSRPRRCHLQPLDRRLPTIRPLLRRSAPSLPRQPPNRRSRRQHHPLSPPRCLPRPPPRLPPTRALSQPSTGLRRVPRLQPLHRRQAPRRRRITRPPRHPPRRPAHRPLPRRHPAQARRRPRPARTRPRPRRRLRLRRRLRRVRQSPHSLRPAKRRGEVGVRLGVLRIRTRRRSSTDSCTRGDHRAAHDATAVVRTGR